MKVKKWKTLKSTVVFSHPRMILTEDVVELPNGKTRDYLRRSKAENHSVAIIALNEKNEVLIQQEYSYPPDEIMWQFPGGSMEPGESIIEAAQRELSEESGYYARKTKLIGYYYTANRLSNQKQYVVVGTELTKRKLPGDADEFISSSWMSLVDLERLIEKGKVTNINLLASLTLLRNSPGYNLDRIED